MSSNYMRVLPKPVPLKTYGFTKVNYGEMQDIVSRLQRKTYNKEFLDGERFQYRPSPPRPPSKMCRKAPQNGKELGPPDRRKIPLDQKTVDKIVRRLRTPTKSLLAARGAIQPAYETDFSRPSSSGEERTSEEKDKAMRMLTRPTTASRSKQFCMFCDDPDVAKHMEWDYADDKFATEEEIDEILARVRTPTVASLADQEPRCSKRTDYNPRRPRNTPLVAGLPKSRNVNEITTRLYRPTESIPVGRPRPETR